MNSNKSLNEILLKNYKKILKEQISILEDKKKSNVILIKIKNK